MNKRELQYKIELQEKQWAQQWAKKLTAESNKRIAEQKRAERVQKALNDEQAMLEAKRLTVEAEQLQERINSFLINNMGSAAISKDALKDNTSFDKPYPANPVFVQPSREPKREDPAFNPTPSFFVKLSSKKMEEFNKDNDSAFTVAHFAWEKERSAIADTNAKRKEYYDNQVSIWNKEKQEFEEKQKEVNAEVDAFFNNISDGQSDSVVEYISLVLNNLNLPLDFVPSYDVEYTEENRGVIVDALFPTIDDLPTLKSVSYIKSKQEYKESYYSDAQLKKTYDSFVYQLVLLYLNEIFNINDTFNLIDSIVLNGIVNTIDKTTGQEITPCILSVRVSKEDFAQLNLLSIDPKAWFRSSKGIAAAAISNVTPVQPVQTISREDKRFVEGYDVVDSIDSGENLAAIDWQDFENLIRELFAKEFNGNGNEVRITQASRDGGVDAVAFDSDPIRGGKIVIQAKRYTNVVGVSAVRDLYGTLINEGAMKGILVTTSYYGNDAYEFAKDKPIQLIDGAGLLGLLQKHGHKARIDLQEAKALLKNDNN